MKYFRSKKLIKLFDSQADSRGIRISIKYEDFVVLMCFYCLYMLPCGLCEINAQQMGVAAMA